MQNSIAANPATTVMTGCTVLGGFGYPFVAGDLLELHFGPTALLAVGPDQRQEVIPLIELLELEISGPGTVKTGGGFIGGGFGVEGAVEGMVIAAVLNTLTAKSKIHTFLSLITHVGELHLHYSQLEPRALRIELSEAFTALRRTNFELIRNRIAVLEMRVASGLLTQADFDLLKNRLLKEPEQKSPSERLGKCPSCSATIPLLLAECPKCKASFGSGAVWKVKAI